MKFGRAGGVGVGSSGGVQGGVNGGASGLGGEKTYGRIIWLDCKALL